MPNPLEFERHANPAREAFKKPLGNMLRSNGVLTEQSDPEIAQLQGRLYAISKTFDRNPDLKQAILDKFGHDGNLDLTGYLFKSTGSAQDRIDALQGFIEQNGISDSLVQEGVHKNLAKEGMNDHNTPPVFLIIKGVYLDEIANGKGRDVGNASLVMQHSVTALDIIHDIEAGNYDAKYAQHILETKNNMNERDPQVVKDANKALLDIADLVLKIAENPDSKAEYEGEIAKIRATLLGTLEHGAKTYASISNGDDKMKILADKAYGILNEEKGSGGSPRRDLANDLDNIPT